MDSIRRAVELLEEREQAFEETRRRALETREANLAALKKKRRGKVIPVFSLAYYPEQTTSNDILDHTGFQWELIEPDRVAPADSVILPHRYHYERRVEGRAGGIYAPDSARIAYDVELPSGNADFVVFDRKHTLDQVLQGDYSFLVRYERHDVDEADFQRFAELVEGLLPEVRVHLDRRLLTETIGDTVEDIWCVNEGIMPVLLARMVSTEPGVAVFTIYLPWSEGHRDVLRIEFAPGCLGKRDVPGGYDVHNLPELLKRDFAGRLAQHTFSVGAPACKPLDLANELLCRPATLDEFELLCDSMRASFNSMREDADAYESWFRSSREGFFWFAGDRWQADIDMELAASVLETQAGFVSEDEFEAMRQTFLAYFDAYDDLVKCVNSMRVDS